METSLEKLDPNPLFPGTTFYRDKEDGFIYTEHASGPQFWLKVGNNFEARETDIYIASYPRTGTTWASELVYLLASDLNYEDAKTKPSRIRYPALNFSEIPVDAFDIPSPRCIRTHLPYNHLPKSITDKKCKIIYTLRNPKDTLVSYYNFALMNKTINYSGDFDTFVKLFLTDQLNFSPFSKHMLQYWEHRHEDNFFFMTFEDKKKDFPSSIKKLAAFLGKTVTEKQIEELADHCSFNSMKSNPNVNFADVPVFDKTKSDFIRKGDVGDWRNYLSEKQSLEIDEYVKKNFAGSGLDFVYDI